MAARFAIRRWTERGTLRFPFMLLRMIDVKSGVQRLARIERYDAEDYAAELAGRRAEPYPCRLSNVMSAAGIGQLQRIEKDLAHRRMLAAELERVLPERGARVLRYDAQRCRPSWVRFPFLVDDPPVWRTRLMACGLEPGQWLNDPCHPRGSNHDFAMYRRGSCPVAERVSQRILNIPVHSGVRLASVRRLERVARAA
jgi:dTDP-4-amino-4,6-dideoxygalactose transaminase